MRMLPSFTAIKATIFLQIALHGPINTKHVSRRRAAQKKILLNTK